MTYFLKLLKKNTDSTNQKRVYHDPVEISEKAINKSRVLSYMIEDCDDESAEIPISYKCSLDILKKFVEYCEYASEIELVNHIDHKYDPIEGRDLEFCELFESDELDESILMIKDLFGLADFLGQPQLQELLKKRVAHHYVKGHCQEDVLKVFKILGIST